MHKTWTAVALLVTTAACGGAATSPPFAAEGADAVGADAAAAEVADLAPDGGADANPQPSPVGARVTVTGAVHDAVTTNPVGGATICVLDAPTACATSASDGTFALAGVPADGSGVVATAAGYATGIWAISASSAPAITLSIRPADHAAGWASDLGTSFDATSANGAIAFSVVDGTGAPLAGATATASPTGTTGYFTPGAGIDGTRTSTSASGGGWIYDLPPGVVGVMVSAPGRTCTRFSVFGWAPDAQGQTLAVPVRAGEVSIVRAVCP